MTNTSQLKSAVSSVLSNYPQNILLVAVSGGADSIALLYSLHSSASSSAVKKINVLHVDHSLRGQESTDDAEFVRAFCEERDIPCKIVKIPPGRIDAYAKRHGTGIEAAARRFRRKALLQEAHRLETCYTATLYPLSSTLILTAHTKDDALELILMRILRGSGPAGLAFMPVKRGRFVRPLLDTSREEIIAYLKENNIPWREDSSNKDEKFLRNKIRHKLIPFLDSHKGTGVCKQTAQWRKGLEGMAATQALVAEFLDAEVKKRIVWEEEKIEERRKKKGKRILSTDETGFFAQLQIIREESIYKGLNLIRVNSCNSRAKTPKRHVIRQFCLGKRKSCDLGRIRIIRENGKIKLIPVSKDFSEAGISYIIS